MTLTFTRWIATIILTFIPVCIPNVVYAQMYHQTSAAADTMPDVTMSTSMTTAKNSLTTTALIALHTRCDTEITARLTSLSRALTRLNSMQKLSADQKQQYTSTVQSNISGLTSLKTKCDADTDAATLQADTKSIVTSYRIYLEFIPQTALLAASDRLNSIVDQFTILTTKLQTRISDAQSQGNNVTSLQSDLADMQTKIADVKTQTATISSQIGLLQPSNVNTDAAGTKTDFQTGRTALQTAQSDVRAALADARLIVSSLLAFPTPAVNPATPSAMTTNSTEAPATTSTNVLPAQ